MPSENRLELNDFVQAWCEQMALALSQASGKTWNAAMTDDGANASDAVHLCFSVSKSLRGEMAIRLATADAVQMARQFTGAAYSGEVVLGGDDRDAFIELLRQVSGLVASVIKPRAGEVEFSGGNLLAIAWHPVSTVTIAVECGAEKLLIHLLLSAELAESLNPAPTPAMNTATLRQLARDGNLDLLMDVELGMTLRFGERRMLLREILDLSSGAVIELDRQVHETVDLLLDNRVVARGEVVIVDGNYGLRITEVASAAQRIETMQ
ncbi:MAG TPA: flagellar motor switch protein FliN [Clostridia bacterium]|nr:flagellar motor switch protein FliN [Clostridia bacterium]